MAKCMFIGSDFDEVHVHVEVLMGLLTTVQFSYGEIGLLGSLP